MKYLSVSLCAFLCLVISDISLGQRFNTGRIGIELSDAGKISVFSPQSAIQKQVYRISLLASADKDHTFSYIGDQDSYIAFHNAAAPEESDFEIQGAVNNSFSKLPPDVIARFNIFGWQNEAYAILKVTLTNKDTLLKDIDPFIGFEFLPQIDSLFQFETIKFNETENIILSYRVPSSTFVGIKLLPNDLSSLRIIDWKDYYERGSGSDSVIYSLMSSGIIDKSLTGGPLGASCLLSQAKVHLSLHDSTYVYLAVALGRDETEVLDNINSASGRYFNKPLAVEKHAAQPPIFQLDQNFPNPFNPSTNISFSIPKQDHVSLKIFDLLGKEITCLINSDLERGVHRVRFYSDSLPGGVYFYRLETSNHSEVRKMMIAK